MKKTCTGCGEEKDLSDFRRDRRRSDGRVSRCKICQRAAHKSAYTVKYVDKYKERNRLRREKASAFLTEYKKSLSCVKCGESEAACLDFHHADPNEKEFGIGSASHYSLERLTKEIEKCIVVCANCHRKIHAGILHV